MLVVIRPSSQVSAGVELKALDGSVTFQQLRMFLDLRAQVKLKKEQEAKRKENMKAEAREQARRMREEKLAAKAAVEAAATGAS